MAGSATLAWALERLPAAEFVAWLHPHADEVIDVVAEGRRRAIGVAVGHEHALSGAPVSVAVLLDEEEPADRVAATLLARRLTALAPMSLIELLGPHDHALAVAQILAVMGGGTVEPVMQQRLWRCTDVVTPRDVPGRIRAMTDDDRPTVARWLDDFSVEALGLEPRGEDAWVDELVEVDGLRLWSVDGTPVAMARGRPTTRSSARVGPVYTPPALRGHGYGAAVTAGLTSSLLAAGMTSVVLLTDMENPISNRLYPRIGYEPVCWHANWAVRFT